MSRDVYREWSYQDRIEAYRDGDREGCRQYDEDRDSGDRAYENWCNGGDIDKMENLNPIDKPSKFQMVKDTFKRWAETTELLRWYKKSEYLKTPISQNELNTKMILGAIYDFSAYLSTRPEQLVISSHDDCSPLVKSIKDFFELRGISDRYNPNFQWEQNCVKSTNKIESEDWRNENAII